MAPPLMDKPFTPPENNVEEKSVTTSSFSSLSLMRLNDGVRATSVQQISEPWEKMIEALQLYKEKHGDCLVPSRYVLNPKLGNWVMTQRRQYARMKNSKPSALTPARVRKLESMGFVWKVRGDKNEIWHKRLKELKKYKLKYGNCLVPQRFGPNPQLGAWVNAQRRSYRLFLESKRSSMTSNRLQALEALDFKWIVRKKESRSSGKKLVFGSNMRNNITKVENDKEKKRGSLFQRQEGRPPVLSPYLDLKKYFASKMTPLSLQAHLIAQTAGQTGIPRGYSGKFSINPENRLMHQILCGTNLNFLRTKLVRKKAHHSLKT